jgi:CDP-diacylglycerol pyrophosphatase
MRRGLIVGAAIVTLWGFVGSVWSADRQVLWRVINSVCVRGQQTTGVPFPCVLVDLTQGFALLRVGTWHLLLTPTKQIEGIESPSLVARGAPNYWDLAWQARDQFDKANGVHLSRDEVGLAVNSAEARTQDQLHIHLGCVRSDVRAALKAHEANIRGTWTRFPTKLAGHDYQIMRLAGETLGEANPFKLVADGIPGAHDHMASETIAVIGAISAHDVSSFYLLADRSRGQYAATAESLLDEGCSAVVQ